jgi:hypothetical protein
MAGRNPHPLRAMCLQASIDKESTGTGKWATTQACSISKTIQYKWKGYAISDDDQTHWHLSRRTNGANLRNRLP